MADENNCNCNCECNSEETTQSTSCIEKSPFFSKANFKYFIDKLTSKIVVAAGVIRFNAEAPLHIEKEATTDGATFKGYIDEATLSSAGLMSADDKSWFQQFSIEGEKNPPVDVEVSNNGNNGAKGPKYTVSVTIDEATTEKAGLMSIDDKKLLLDLEGSGVYWKRYAEENVNALPSDTDAGLDNITWEEFKWVYDKRKVTDTTNAEAQPLADDNNTGEIAEGKMFFPLAGNGVPGLMTSTQVERGDTLWSAFGDTSSLGSFLRLYPTAAFSDVGICGTEDSGLFVDTINHFASRSSFTDLTIEGVWFIYQDKFYVMALDEEILQFSDDNGINASIGTIPNTKESFYSEIHDGRMICKEHLDDGAWACNAIKYCNGYSTKSTNAGSWWLPSVSELRTMMRLYQQLNIAIEIINQKCGSGTATKLSSSNYMSCNTLPPSERYPDGLVVNAVLSGGWIGGSYLTDNLRVRPITLVHSGDLAEVAVTTEYQQPVIAVVYPDAEAEGGSVNPTVAYSQPYKDSDGNSGAITSGGELNFEEA